MNQLTWGEFKKRVEAAGVKDETEIDYIDIDGYNAAFDGEPEIVISRDRTSFHVS